jgi:hypothetical protein
MLGRLIVGLPVADKPASRVKVTAGFPALGRGLPVTGFGGDANEVSIGIRSDYGNSRRPTPLVVLRRSDVFHRVILAMNESSIPLSLQ